MPAPSSAILRGAMQLGVNWLLRVKDGSTIVKPVSTIKFIGATVSQDGTDPYQANVNISGSFAGLRYASIQSFAGITIAAGGQQAPIDFMGAGAGTKDDPDGLFTPHTNVITIPSSWTTNTGFCNVLVSFGVMATGGAGTPSAGCILSRLWVFESFGSSTHESVVWQSAKGYRDFADCQAGTIDPTLGGAIQIPKLQAGNVIELDFMNQFTGGAVVISAPIFSTPDYGPAFLGIIRISDG